MPEKTGQIPRRTKVKELERVYVTNQKEIGSVLLTIDPATFSDLLLQNPVPSTIMSENFYAICFINGRLAATFPMGFDLH